MSRSDTNQNRYSCVIVAACFPDRADRFNLTFPGGPAKRVKVTNVSRKEAIAILGAQGRSERLATTVLDRINAMVDNGHGDRAKFAVAADLEEK